jgi:hypothetical protein
MIKIFHLQSITLLLSILTCICFSGCASTEEMEIVVQQNVALQQKNAQLSIELAAQSALAVKLQMKLVEKQSEINKLSSMERHEGAKEVVRDNVKIRIPANKAEAVAFLAEVGTNIDSAREIPQSNGQQQSLIKADQLMAESKAELEQGSYSKASILAGQALELVRAAQTVQVHPLPLKKPPLPSSTDFLAPLSMQISKRSNFRKHPDIHSQILQVLEPGTEVTAIGYQGHWIKITLKNQQTGWIYYSLLAVPGA